MLFVLFPTCTQGEIALYLANFKLCYLEYPLKSLERLTYMGGGSPSLSWCAFMLRMMQASLVQVFQGVMRYVLRSIFIKILAKEAQCKFMRGHHGCIIMYMDPGCDQEAGASPLGDTNFILF